MSNYGYGAHPGTVGVKRTAPVGGAVRGGSGMHGGGKKRVKQEHFCDYSDPDTGVHCTYSSTNPNHVKARLASATTTVAGCRHVDTANSPERSH